MRIGEGVLGEPETSFVGQVQVAVNIARPASIGLACPTTGHRGKPVRVSGTVRPSHVKAPVEVEFRSVASGNRILLANTDRLSHYTADITPDKAGRWRIQARWPGDRDHQAAESPACLVNIS